MAIRKIKRGGKTALVIDISIMRDGKQVRSRADASSQNMYAAKAEEKERLHNLRLYGSIHAPERDQEESRPAPTEMTLAAFWDDVYSRGALRLKSPGTQEGYRNVWTRKPNGLLVHLGGEPLSTIDGARFQRFAADLTDAGVSPRPALILLKALLTDAVTTKKLAAMPQLPKGLFKEPKKLPSCPDASEVRVVIEGASGWLKVALVLCFYNGLRMGEMRALTPGDFDLDRGTVRIEKAFSSNTLRQRTKTAADRQLPLSDEAVAYLREALKGMPRDRLIFHQRSGRPLRRQNVYNTYQRLRTRLGLRPRSFHATRHFFCSQLLAVGVDLETARSLTGHESITSFERYAHTTDIRRREAVAKVAVGTR